MVESVSLGNHGQYTFCNVLKAEARTFQVLEGKPSTFCVLSLYVQLFALEEFFEVRIALGHGCTVV